MVGNQSMQHIVALLADARICLPTIMDDDEDDEDVEPRRRQGVVVGAGGWKIFQALSMQLYIQHILN
jgi:hypothetical protein